MLSLFDSGKDSRIAIGSLDRPGLSYRALRSQARRIGAELRRIGISADSRVAIVLPNGPLMASTFLCCSPWCAVAPLNPSYTRDEHLFFLEDLEANLLLVESGTQSVAADAASSLNIPVREVEHGECAGEFTFGVTEQNVENMEIANAALILHTSGTTSRPKMVPLTQRNLMASARNIGSTLKLIDEDVCLNVMPLFHIHGLMAPLLASISAGANVTCTPGFDALRFFAWLDEVQPTWYSAVPTMHQAILQRARRNMEIVERSRLRFIRSSSASLPPQVMHSLEETFDSPVIEAYAMTEAAHQMCSNPLPPKVRKSGTVGPAAGPEVAILADKNICSSGVLGEIVIRGENVTTGYLNNPDANENAFFEGWFRTGDQGVIDEDGYVKITGRLKEIINRGGEKIAPLEIDEVLLDHPAVAQACVFALPHDSLGEDVGAVVVLKQGETTEVRELQAFARERIANFKVPRTIVFANEIPKGPTGKVQRIGLAETLGLTT